MLQKNEQNPFLQVKEIKDGKVELFSFELPKGQLSKKQIEAYLKFLKQNEICDVMKALIHIYFTAADNDSNQMHAEERLAFEQTLVFLADHIC